MKTLEVTPSNALKAFNSADANGKKLLTDLFGKEVFNKKITDIVKTFRDACEILSIDPTNMIMVGMYPSGNDEASVNAYCQLIVIARALNEGWTPDWEDSNQAKWYPYFKMKSGFGFSTTGYGFTHTHSGVGSRLCFKSEELAQYAGKQFESIYRDFITL